VKLPTCASPLDRELLQQIVKLESGRLLPFENGFDDGGGELQAMLGLQQDAPRGKLYVDPALPAWLPDLTLINLRMADSRTSYEMKKSFWNFAKMPISLNAGRGDLPVRDLIPLSLLRARGRSGILLTRGRLGRVGLWHMWLHTSAMKGIVLQNSKIAELRKSSKCSALAILATARLCRIDTSASDRFCGN
jgi:hypothetical protein